MVSYNKNCKISELAGNSKYLLIDKMDIMDTKLWFQLIDKFYSNLDVESSLRVLDLLLQLNLFQDDYKAIIQSILSSVLRNDRLMTKLPDSLWSKLLLYTMNMDMDSLEKAVLDVILRYVKIRTLPSSIIDHCLKKGSVARINILTTLISNSPFHMIIFENRLSKFNLYNFISDSPEFLNLLLYYSENINRDNTASGKYNILIHLSHTYLIINREYLKNKIFTIYCLNYQ